MDIATTASELLKQEVGFALDVFQAAELEARSTERYVLIALGGMDSYLATKQIPEPFRRLAWYAPSWLTAFAALRALALGWRQRQVIAYLYDLECRVSLTSLAPGWAKGQLAQLPFVALSAVAFYGALLFVTLGVARRMTKVARAEVLSQS